MKAIFFSIWLLALAVPLCAEDHAHDTIYWYQIHLTTGSTVSSFTGSSEDEWPLLQDCVTQGGFIKLDNLRELYLGAWRKSDAETELLNARMVVHITKLKGDPLKPAAEAAKEH